MAFVETGNDGTTNGVTEVQLVPPPTGSNRHVIKSVKICNVDTVGTNEVQVYVKNGANKRYVCQITPSVKDTIQIEESDCDVLDSTSKSLCVQLANAKTTSDMTFVASYAIVS